MPVTSSQVSSLRSRTGVSILACKDALEEAVGDEEKAIEILKKRGMVQAAKKAGRDQGEGKIFLAQDKGKAALVLLRCETDFVARDEHFVTAGQDLAQCLLTDGESTACKKAEAAIPDLINKLGENISFEEKSYVIEAPVVGAYVHTNGKIGVVIGLDSGEEGIAKDIAMHAAAMSPDVVSPDDIDDSAVAKEKEIWTEQLSTEGKPPEIIEKIMIGKEKKFREEKSLLKQDFVKEPGKTVEQVLGDAHVIHYVRVDVS